MNINPDIFMAFLLIFYIVFLMIVTFISKCSNEEDRKEIEIRSLVYRIIIVFALVSLAVTGYAGLSYGISWTLLVAPFLIVFFGFVSVLVYTV